MPWQKQGLLLGLVLLTLFPRVLDLDAWRAPDEDRWMANTNGFTNKLAHGRFDSLVQQPHPGITTQWLGALTIRYDNWATRKLPLVIGQSLLILVAGYVLARLWGPSAGVATVVALAANPVLYAHTRIYAMDSLLALFSLLALGFLLLWHQEKNRAHVARYLYASAFCTAAAILSKLSGVALIPIIGGTLLYWSWPEKKLQAPAAWLIAFLMSLAVILPSFAIAPGSVLGDFQELFRSDDYQALHQSGPAYYLGTLVFFSTPLQWLGLIALGWLALTKKLSRRQWEQLLVLLSFAILMVIQMTLGAKKGDRYILPSFVMLDVISAFVIARIYTLSKEFRIQNLEFRKKYLLLTSCFLLLTFCIAWQYLIIWQTHPHTLAYVNPLTSHWFGERRHGWGEGLDLAAAYLNQKPGAADLKVATYYPSEVQPYLRGEAVPAHQHDEPSVDYVIIYRAMFDRGPDAWETDVVQHYEKQPPEKVIAINGLPMVWVYSRAAADEPPSGHTTTER